MVQCTRRVAVVVVGLSYSYGRVQEVACRGIFKPTATALKEIPISLSLIDIISYISLIVLKNF